MVDCSNVGGCHRLANNDSTHERSRSFVGYWCVLIIVTGKSCALVLTTIMYRWQIVKSPMISLETVAGRRVMTGGLPI